MKKLSRFAVTIAAAASIAHPALADEDCSADEEAEAAVTDVRGLSLTELERTLSVSGTDVWTWLSDGGEGTSPSPSEPIPTSEGTLVVEQQHVARLALISVCDSDGTHCGNVDPVTAQLSVDGMNAAHYRSGSRLRFKIQSRYQAQLRSDAVNNRCKPVADLTRRPRDANGDRVSDEADAAYLCPEVVDISEAEALGKTLEGYGLIPVFVRGGMKDVVWDAQLGHWKPVRLSVGFSGCSLHGAYLPTIYGATFVGHELGHYFCLAHTHKKDRPEDLDEAADRIEAAAIDYVDPASQKAKVLTDAFDGDAAVKKTGVYAFLNDTPVLDTPPDAGEPLWKEVFGGKCALEDATLDIMAKVGSPAMEQTFTVAPDRTILMSYFGSCYPDHVRLSKDEVARAHAAATHHRASVAPVVAVEGWQNMLKVTIPPRPGTLSPLQYATSTITTTGTGTVARVKAYVSITHDVGNLEIRLVGPNGKEYPLKYMHDPAKSPTGNIRKMYAVTDAGLPHAGTWKLKVGDRETHATVAVRRIDGWRIELE